MNNNKLIKDFGFTSDSKIDVQGRYSISDKFPKSSSRTVIYLLYFSDDTFYIGQAVNVVRRFSQHRKNYDNIESLWFQCINKELLDDVEKKLIQSAEQHAFLLTNKTFVSNITGDSDLDEVLSKVDQKLWLINSESIESKSGVLYEKTELKYKIKYRHRFLKLKQLDIYGKIKELLYCYIKYCIPAYGKTEMSFWSLSCMSSTNSAHAPRYICLNINAMEVLVIGYIKKTNSLFAFVVVSNHFKKNFFGKIEFRYKRPGLKIQSSNYQAAGLNQVQIEIDNLKDFTKFLQSENEITNAIKDMNLRLMRKGGTIYSQYHCLDLVNDIMNEEHP